MLGSLLYALLIRYRKLTLVFGLLIALASTVGFIFLRREYQTMPEKPVPLDVQSLHANRVPSETWVSIQGDGFRCRELPFHQTDREEMIDKGVGVLLGTEAVRKLLFLSDPSGSIVVVAMFSEEASCRDFGETERLEGVISDLSPEWRARLLEAYPGFDEYSNADHYYSLCAFCGRGNTKIGLILCAVFILIGIFLSGWSMYMINVKSLGDKNDRHMPS